MIKKKKVAQELHISCQEKIHQDQEVVLFIDDYHNFFSMNYIINQLLVLLLLLLYFVIIENKLNIALVYCI